MSRSILCLFCFTSLLVSCNEKIKTKNKLIGHWNLSEAFNSDGEPCAGLDVSKNCLYNKDQTWQFNSDSTFVSKFTSFVAENYGDTIVLSGKYKTYQRGAENLLELTIDRFLDSLRFQTFTINTLTDSVFEYTKRKYEDGSGGMRLVFKRN